MLGSGEMKEYLLANRADLIDEYAERGGKRRTFFEQSIGLLY